MRYGKRKLPERNYYADCLLSEITESIAEHAAKAQALYPKYDELLEEYGCDDIETAYTRAEIKKEQAISEEYKKIYNSVMFTLCQILKKSP